MLENGTSRVDHMPVDGPPPSSIEPVTDFYHEIAIVDPYRWLEEPESERTRGWLACQAAYTRLYLDSIAGRERIRSRITELLSGTAFSDPRKVGSLCFYLKREIFQKQPVIMMRDECAPNSNREIMLVDPVAKDPTGKTAVNIVAISRDARLLAYSVREGGRDAFAIEFFDVPGRKILKDRLAEGSWRGFALGPSGDGFYYSRRPYSDNDPHSQTVYWHSLGADFVDDREIVRATDDPDALIGLLSSHKGSFLGVSVVSLSGGIATDFYVLDLRTGVKRKVVERMPGLFLPSFAGNQILALTDWEAPNGRVVAIDIDRPQPEHWRNIVGPRASRVEDFSIAGEKIFIGSVLDGAMQVEIFDLGGHRQGALPCPTGGTARILPCTPDSDVLFYKFTSFAHPPAIFCYDTRTGTAAVWPSNELSLSKVADLNVERTFYASRDGTQIPIFLVSRKSLSRRLLPVFLTAYGGFGASMTPRFTAYATFLMEQGVLVALANIRGGSEFGENWHRAGKRRNRQNAIDDFIAAAEWLLSSGIAAPGRIAIGGGSNAGLLVGAALTQRPDLFRAAICLGPLLDMLRYHRFDSAADWIDEYGSADNKDDFICLRAYSPYHNVQHGVHYPAVLIISGDADTRCNPLHARKMCARLQAATGSGYPVLLDYKTNWGHVPVQPLDIRIEALTDRMAFICHELELTV